MKDPGNGEPGSSFIIRPGSEANRRMTNAETRMTNQTTNDKLQCPLTRLRRVLVIVVCRLLFAV